MEMQSTSDHKEVTNHELKSSDKILRIQNLQFVKDEILYKLLAKLLSTVLNLTPHKLILELNHAYRQHTSYTRKAKFSLEVFVKFTRRFTQDSILQEVHDKELEIKGNTVHILKEIPWRIQQQRKECCFLTKILTENRIQYKWLFPEGLNFVWEGKPITLDSILTAQGFAIYNAQYFFFFQTQFLIQDWYVLSYSRFIVAHSWYRNTTKNFCWSQPYFVDKQYKRNCKR